VQQRQRYGKVFELILVPVSKKHRNFKGNNPISQSGLASSVAFTPIKGIELENPELQVSRKETSDRYFGGFKVPAPVKK
jgi:U4/U6 small nuclear ribonucleoprotein PRP31